jgi:hypothetical protein
MNRITEDREFHNPFEVLEWKTLQEGVSEAILYVDEESGTYCRMVKLEPEAATGTEPLCHEFDEIVYIVSGCLINQRLSEKYEAGFWAFFPKRVKHGPLMAPVGAVVIETRHYLKSGNDI